MGITPGTSLLAQQTGHSRPGGEQLCHSCVTMASNMGVKNIARVCPQWPRWISEDDGEEGLDEEVEVEVEVEEAHLGVS